MTTNLMQFIHAFVGVPSTDIEYILLMLIASCFMVLVTVAVLDLFKLIGSYLGGGR